MTQLFTFPAQPARAAWPLVVVGSREITPRLRRVSLIGECLEGFVHRPGQSLVLSLPQPGGALARRHYTIRDFDREELRLDIDLVAHGQTPGVRWAQSARIGDPILAEGPRGHIGVRHRADWHLFAGDETALPAIAAMIESLPAGARAYVVIEVSGPDEEDQLDTAAELEALWVHRRGPPAAESAALVEPIRSFQFPDGVGQAYLMGETHTVRAQRHALIARGLPKEQILAEGYWRPGRIGGHDHVEDIGDRVPRGRMRRRPWA